MLRCCFAASGLTACLRDLRIITHAVLVLWPAGAVRGRRRGRGTQALVSAAALPGSSKALQAYDLCHVNIAPGY